MTHVLVVDDDANLRLALRKALTRKGALVSEAEDGETALPLLQSGRSDLGDIDVCVLDLRMPKLSGLEVLKRSRERPVPTVILTGHGTIPDAVEAMRLGADNFVQKPVDADELWPVLEQAVRTHRQGHSATIFLGESETFKSFLHQLDRAATTEESVLLLGETGTGKELAARRLHQKSHRATYPFVAVNAPSVPRELFESELFGHLKGSFTGADKDRVGLLAQAKKGTLFIDEIGDLPLEAQVKLLRAIEERRFRPVGADEERPFEARIVAATHQDLPQMVEQKHFRADLYYRLSVLPLRLPRLSERDGDAELIAEHWLTRLLGTDGMELSDSAKDVLRRYSFPGNIRELINLMKRAVIFHEGGEISGDELEALLHDSPFASLSSADPMGGTQAGSRVTLETLEKEHISRLLDDVKNVSEVARIVGIDRRTLQRKMLAWGLRDTD